MTLSAPQPGDRIGTVLTAAYGLEAALPSELCAMLQALYAVPGTNARANDSRRR